MLSMLKSHRVTYVAVYGGAIALLIGALWVAYQYVDPAPPSKVTIATGGPTGAYYNFARQYAAIFAEQGIELEIIQTNGSMDNLDRLSGDSPSVDAAFMQGGITTPEEHPALQSLGSLYYEPIWVAYNKRTPLQRLSGLRDLKIAIGPEGSGTNHVARSLLSENGITSDNNAILSGPYSETIPAFVNGDIDVLFLISGINSPFIQDVSRSDSTARLLSFDRAEAYTRAHRYLKKLVLPKGAISMARNQPREDVHLLAPTANLVVKEDLHPAIKFLFLLAASKVHFEGDVFAKPGEFPNKEAILFPLSDEAKSFYKNGPPLLMRFMPFSIAITLERLKILLIPLLTLLYPLFKVTPPAYRWQIRRRIFKWYKDLKELDLEAYEIQDKEAAKEMLAKLEELDRQVLETSVPISYADNIYSLRQHIRLIQDRLAKV